MKNNLKLILMLTLILMAFLCRAQTPQITQKDTIKASKPHIVTKTVTLTSTENDYFPEEMEKFNRYVEKHIKPIKGVHGIVTIGFTDEEDGSITHVRIVKSLNKAADQQALRVVSSYHKWIPNTIDGKPMRSTIEIPITYK